MGRNGRIVEEEGVPLNRRVYEVCETTKSKQRQSRDASCTPARFDGGRKGCDPSIAHFHPFSFIRVMAGRLGGLTEARVPTPEVHTLGQEVKEQIEGKAGRPFEVFEVTHFATQVAGVNYFLKIHVGRDEYVHARVYQDIKQSKSVHSVQTGKTRDDVLAYF